MISATRNSLAGLAEARALLIGSVLLVLVVEILASSPRLSRQPIMRAIGYRALT